MLTKTHEDDISLARVPKHGAPFDSNEGYCASNSDYLTTAGGFCQEWKTPGDMATSEKAEASSGRRSSR